jgi:serine/threonine protein phosphatase PrpC
LQVAASCGVTHCPEVSLVDITAADAFAIWASDGVWEFIESQQAANIVAACANAVRAQ